MTEDRLAKIHREWREQCIKAGTYKGVTQELVDSANRRWLAECNRPPRKTKARKHPPKGHAD